MKSKLTGYEKERIIDALLALISNKCDVSKYDNTLKESYADIIKKDESGSLLILNDFYVDDTTKEKIVSYSDEDLGRYVSSNYRELLISDLGHNTSYNIDQNLYNVNYDNLVKNGTLVFMVKLSINMNIKGIMIKFSKFKRELEKIETELQIKLGIPVRILHKEEYIKKNN